MVRAPRLPRARDGLRITVGEASRHHATAGDFHVDGAGNIDANASDLLLAPAPGESNKDANM